MHRAVRRVLSLVIAAVAAAAVVGTALLLTGQYAVVATNGVSMNPTYYEGDLVVVERSDTYRTGEIVAYHRPDKDLVVLHRIIGGDPAGFVFQGDNNASVDPTRPTREQLIGRAVLHVPRGGTWLHRLTAPPLLAAYTLLLLLGGGRAAATTRRHRRKDLPMPRHRARPIRPDVLPAAARSIGVGAVVIGVAGLATSALAWTRPVAHAVPTSTPDRSTMAFSYTAHVARSAAYDGTTVTAPQPVFRRLATALDVSYHYTGRPGRLTVSAQLETGSGWSTRVPLGPSTTVGASYRGSVRLDLPSLERRARAAARVTGLPMGQVTVAVVPSMSFDSGGSFSPRLELVLDPLVVRSRGALSARSPLSVAAHRSEPTRLGLLGKSFAVSSLRGAGGAATGFGVLLAALWAVLARLAGPHAQADRILARYRDLMLPVMPLAESGQPVVEVPDVASLARLADRYGLLILHWSHEGGHTYVVQAEGTTYRCRVTRDRRLSEGRREDRQDVVVRA